MQPSHGDVFQSAYAHLRVLDIDVWLNSKIFFRSRRAQYLPGATSKAVLPVMIHMNYVSRLPVCLECFDQSSEACFASIDLLLLNQIHTHTHVRLTDRVLLSVSHTHLQHPDKHKRMLCLMDRYYYNKLDACDQMPGGSEPGT